jgi:hypothetical protein
LCWSVSFENKRKGGGERKGKERREGRGKERREGESEQRDIKVRLEICECDFLLYLLKIKEKC